MATRQDLLLAAAQMAKKAGGGKEKAEGPGKWLTCCPVKTHGKGQGDQSPSLIIRVDQQIQFKCLAGCDDKDIRSAFIDLGFKIIPIATGKGSAAGTTINKVAHEERPSDEWVISALKPRRAPDAVYIYRNEHSQTAFCVVRINPKPPNTKKFVRSVCSVREQGATTDFWLDKAYPKNERYLYNLPEILARLDAPVLVVEGEKTAEAAMLMPELRDYVVTTWVGGAGAVPYSRWTALAGRDVVLWPDNDQAGVKAMKDVAARIVKGRNAAKSVKLVFEVPLDDPEGFPLGWDLADTYEDTYTPIDYMLKSALDIDPRAIAEVTQPADDDEITARLDAHLGKYVAVMVGTGVEYVNIKSASPHSTDPLPYACHTKVALEQIETARYRAGDRPRTFIKNYLDSDKKIWGRGWIYDPSTLDRIVPYGDDRRINLYAGLAHPPKECDEARYMPYIDHIRASCGSEEVADYLLDWLAFKIQYPHRMPETMVVLSGPEGCGKSIICDVMRYVFGAHNAVQITMQDLKRDFNSHYSNKLFIAVEEYAAINTKAYREYRDRIKNLISAKHLIVNGKHVPQYQNPAYHAIIATTNATEPEDISFDNRRMSFIPFFNPVLRKEGERLVGNKEYFDPIVRLEEDPIGLAGLCHYLMNRKIDMDRVRKPLGTAMTQEAMTFTDNPVMGFLQMVAETGTLPDSNIILKEKDDDGNDTLYPLSRWDIDQAAIMPRRMLSEMFRDWYSEQYREPIGSDKASKWLRKALPSHPRGIPKSFRVDMQRRWSFAMQNGEWDGRDRPICLPSIGELREIVEKMANSPIRWSEMAKEEPKSDEKVVDLFSKMPKEF